MEARAATDRLNTAAHFSWIQRIAEGDRLAEAEFVAAFQAGVRALIRRHARPADPIVDDLVQDVLHTVIMRLREGALQEPAALPGYVRSTAVFAVTAEYRRRSRRGADDHSSELLDGLPAPDEPAEHARRTQLREGVQRMLAELSVERDREVLRRYYLHEDDRETICTALSIAPDHFHRVLHRARERLKELLLRHGIAAAQ